MKIYNKIKISKLDKMQFYGSKIENETNWK